MDAIKKFFDKKKTDTKFKRLGQGQRYVTFCIVITNVAVCRSVSLVLLYIFHITWIRQSVLCTLHIVCHHVPLSVALCTV